MDEIDLWKVVLYRKRGTHVSTHYISRLKKSVYVKNSIYNSLVETNEHLRDACAKYHALKNDADDI